ncbi:hypothetical protein INT47_004993 [Mucor saturninus]|uniref:Homologous-pairing protein 2 homolog n=1 Tax=Mucor saturninus TaxID=64648 RepID=A0A8H7QSR8_9FUNG|nr:hypothetical protein INT47_004993 [Mucor saturninus]
MRLDTQEEVVLDYLTKSNRPYSATDIFNNLHNKYSKTNITKALDRLVEDETVFSKMYGKTTIYSVKQQEGSAEEDMEALVRETLDKEEKIQVLVSENRKLETALATIKSEPTTSEAAELVKKLGQENELLRERLEHLKNGTVLISPEKRKRTQVEYEQNRNLWKKRRSMFREIFSTVTEHLPGKPSDLKEELGIEEDEIAYEQDPLLAG